MRRALLGLGSNVGDRRANLQAAVNALAAEGVLRRPSRAFTTPIPSARCSTSRASSTPACSRTPTSSRSTLLDAAKRIERDLGRAEPAVRHGPRPIDIDILLLGEVESATHG